MVRSSWVAAVLVATAALPFAGNERVAAGSAHEPPVRVTADDRSAPQRCRPRAVGRMLANLFTAAARGSASDVRRSLAPRSRFEWYSLTTVSGERRVRHVVRRHPVSAATLLADRARLSGERIRVAAIEMSYERRRNIAHTLLWAPSRRLAAAPGRHCLPTITPVN